MITCFVILNAVKDLAEFLGENSSGELKFPSSQPTLSYRVGPRRGDAAIAIKSILSV